MLNQEVENAVRNIEAELAKLDFFADKNNQSSNEEESLYSGIAEPKIQMLFAKLHTGLKTLFSNMNDCIPSDLYGGEFNGLDSIVLSRTIYLIEMFQRGCEGSEYSFEIDPYYRQLFEDCKRFLNDKNYYGNSYIPEDFELVTIYYTKPIFILKEMVKVTHVTNEGVYCKKLIGEGSYAHVYRYKDAFYHKKIVMKVAKDNLTEEELQRFYNEFDMLKTLHSPYIVEVYRLDKEKNAYYMESMDKTLKDYIDENNGKLTLQQRERLLNQIYKAFEYIHGQNMLHRDISPTNLLVKCFDDGTVIVKVSDFGLVKTPDSQLTKVHTEIKGAFNDPSLLSDGFCHYTMAHEIYALTRLCYFVLTGRTNLEKSAKYKKLIEAGCNEDKEKRPKTIKDLMAIVKCCMPAQR